MRVIGVNILQILNVRGQFRLKYCEEQKNDKKEHPVLFCLAVEHNLEEELLAAFYKVK